MAPHLMAALEDIGARADKIASMLRLADGPFGPSAGGLLLADALVAQGVPLDDPRSPHADTAFWWNGQERSISFIVKDRLMHVSDGSDGGAVVTFTIGPVRVSAPLFERLARVQLDEERRVLRDDAAGCRIELGRVFRPDAARDALAWLDRTATYYEGELAQASTTYERGDARPDLVATFADAGLSVPTLPLALVGLLRRVGPSWWATSDVGPDPVEDFAGLMEPASNYLEGPVVDHTTIILGHRVITWQLAFGPLAFGGRVASFADPMSVAQQALLFRRLSGLVDALDQERFPLSRTPRVRAICIDLSDVRDIAFARRWDSVSGEWQDWLRPSENEPLADSQWWAALAEGVRRAVEPR